MDHLKAALEAAKIGGDELRKYWGKLTSVEEKAYPGDLVTEADKASEKAILTFLSKTYPSHAFLSEEAGALGEAEALWIIDPLDGTTNYTHCYPFVAVSIALWVRGVPEVAVIYNPIFEELFVAKRGEGATLNGKTLQVSTTSSLQKALLATGFSYGRAETRDNNYAEFAALTNVTQGVRRAGSAALDLAYLAAGKLDGYWERGLKPWDLAAGVLLVEEAGGKVTAYKDKPLDLFRGEILASNGPLHEPLSEELQSLQR